MIEGEAKVIVENSEDIIHSSPSGLANVAQAEAYLRGLEEGRQEEREKGKGLWKYLSHKQDCTLRFCEACEPTEDGGYRIKVKGKWYQSKPKDETQRCDCGLDKVFDQWGKDK